MGFAFFFIFVVMIATIPLFMFPIALVEQFKYGEKRLPVFLLSFLVVGLPILIFFLVPSFNEIFSDLTELSLMQGLLTVGWFVLIIGSLVVDMKRFSRVSAQQAEARKAIDESRASRKQAKASQEEALYYADWAKIKDGYSYARDRLKSHISMPDGAEKTMEILDDVIRTIDDYIYGKNRKIAAWDFGELTQYLSEAKSRGLNSVVMAQREVKMMRPILAGLKKLVLISDCGFDEKDIPDDVDKILKIKGPREVDEVIKYLSGAGLA
jgi:hypothetical protein